MLKVIVRVVIIAGLILSCKEDSKLPDPLEAGWKGEKVCQVIHEDKTVRVLKCIFQPNVGHEWHQHQPHFGYTLKGSTFRIKDHQETRTVTVPSGSTFSNLEVSEHEVLNIGDSTAVFLITEYK